MHFETDGNNFIEAKVRNKIQSRGEEHGEETKMAMDIPFVAVLPAEYILSRLAVQEAGVSYAHMFHRPDGSIRTFGFKEIKVDREFKDYRMTISFSALDTEKSAETFVCQTIQITKMTPEDRGMMSVEFTVQLHPYKAQDIGNLHKKGIEIGIKQCFLQFEEQQKDLANAA
jgi:hypothetical protein